MRTPSDFIVFGFVVAILSVIPFGAGIVLGDGWQPVGFFGAVAMWGIGGLLVQAGIIGLGVHIGLRARADERAREARPKSKPPKLNTAGQVAAEKVRKAAKR